MAEKYSNDSEKDKNKESAASKALKIGAAVLFFSLGIDILRNR